MNRVYAAGANTGIGSVPHKNMDQALKLIQTYCPEIPHWPQLPGVSNKEGIIEQYLAPMIQCGLVQKTEQGSPFINTDLPDYHESLAKFYELCLMVEEDPANIDVFSFPKENASGYYRFIELLESGNWQPTPQGIKGQLIGPFAIGFTLCDQRRRSTYYDDQLRDVLVKNLAFQAAWQTKQLLRFQHPAMVFIDDPGTYALGTSTHVTVKAEDVSRDLNTIVESIHAQGGLAGVHVCARTDWTSVIKSGIDVLSFDAYEYFDSLAPHTDAIKELIERGGYLAWGLIPTSEAAKQETPASLLDKWNDWKKTLESRGIKEKDIIASTLFTPSCGTGTLSESLAETIYEKSLLVSNLFRKII